MSGSSGVPAVDRVHPGTSIDSDHVTILCPVMEANRVQATVYSRNTVMCNPVRVGVMFLVFFVVFLKVLLRSIARRTCPKLLLLFIRFSILIVIIISTREVFLRI